MERGSQIRNCRLLEQDKVVKHSIAAPVVRIPILPHDQPRIGATQGYHGTNRVIGRGRLDHGPRWMPPRKRLLITSAIGLGEVSCLNSPWLRPTGCRSADCRGADKHWD